MKRASRREVECLSCEVRRQEHIETCKRVDALNALVLRLRRDKERLDHLLWFDDLFRTRREVDESIAESKAYDKRNAAMKSTKARRRG